MSVTTLAGTSRSVRSDRFTYRACVVPALVGKSLKTAKKRLGFAGCKLGKVKTVAAAATKIGKVIKQSRKAGTVLVPRSKVGVTIGK